MSRRERAISGVVAVLRVAVDPELVQDACCCVETQDALTEVRNKSENALQYVTGAVAARAKDLVEVICEMCTACIAFASEFGLGSARVATLLAESLAAASCLFAPEDEEVNTTDRGIDRLKWNHHAPIARFIEPVAAALDSFILDIYQGLRRLDVVLQPHWIFSRAGHGGSLSLGVDYACAADVELFCSLQSVCVWAMTLLTRAVGHRNFTSLTLWEFSGEDSLSALLLVQGVLGYQQWSWEQTSSQQSTPPPDDLPELRDAALGAALGLARADLAFSSSYTEADDGQVNMATRHEELVLHRAMLAASLLELSFLDTCLAYPWSSGLLGDERLPAFVDFLKELSNLSCQIPRWSSFLQHLGEQVEQWEVHVADRAPALWDLLVQFACAKRGFIRSCASLAHCAPPSPDTAARFVQACLSAHGNLVPAGTSGVAAVEEDPTLAAGLMVLVSNAGCTPGNDALSGVLSHMQREHCFAIVQRVKEWDPRLVRADQLRAWVDLVTGGDASVMPSATDAQTEAMPMVQTRPEQLPSALRLLFEEVPQEFRCSIDNKLLVDPVRCPAGYLFERAVLAKALDRGGGICPITGAPRSIADCPRDTQVRRRIRDWVRQQQPKRK